MTHPPAGPSTPTPPPGPRDGRKRMAAIPTWTLIQAIQGVSLFLLLIGGLVIVQADQLGYLPCDCDGKAVNPTIAFTYVREGMGSR